MEEKGTWKTSIESLASAAGKNRVMMQVTADEARAIVSAFMCKGDLSDTEKEVLRKARAALRVNEQIETIVQVLNGSIGGVEA